MKHTATKKGWKVWDSKLHITSRQFAENTIEYNQIMNGIK